MLESYRTLAFARVPDGTVCAETESRAVVDLDAPAVAVMTDFRHTRSLCISPRDDIDAALRCMKVGRVRMLLVASPSGRFLGLVTADDIRGARPIGLPDDTLHELTTVDQVMQPRRALQILPLSAIASARVGDVVVTLREIGQQHALVIDHRGAGCEVRGLFSSAEIARRLGYPIEVFRRAETFTQLAMMLQADTSPIPLNTFDLHQEVHQQ